MAATRTIAAIVLMGIGAAIALALLPLFPPMMVQRVDEAQRYVLQLKQGVQEPRQKAQPNFNRLTPRATPTMPPPTSTFPVVAIPSSTPNPTAIPPTLVVPVIPSSTPAILKKDLPKPVPTSIPLPLTPTLIAAPTPDPKELKEYMLILINEDRRRHGLSPVLLGTNAAAQDHAEDKLQNGYNSHWGIDGLTPYMRYTLAGGVNYEAENGSGPAFLMKGVAYLERSAKELLKDDQEGFMNSPGHRENILNKWHKKVNLGIACSKFTCSVVQQFEGDYIEFSKKPTISTGTLSFAGTLKGGFTLEGAGVWYDQPPHPLTLGQLDATYAYLTGQQPATFLREPLTGGYYYPDSSTTFTWEAGLDPYSLDPNTPRRRSPPLQPSQAKFKVVPWTTASIWRVSGQSFEIKADISSVLNRLGPGVYKVIIWGTAQGESVPLTDYSIFVK